MLWCTTRLPCRNRPPIGRRLPERLAARATCCSSESTFEPTPVLPTPDLSHVSYMLIVPTHPQTVVKPGFNAPANLTIGATAQALLRCPANTYRAGTTAYNPTVGLTCTPCATGLRTLPFVDGATSRDACLVAPGSGFNAATGTAAECTVGSYGIGWNRSALQKRSAPATAAILTGLDLIRMQAPAAASCMRASPGRGHRPPAGGRSRCTRAKRGAPSGSPSFRRAPLR